MGVEVERLRQMVVVLVHRRVLGVEVGVRHLGGGGGGGGRGLARVAVCGVMSVTRTATQVFLRHLVGLETQTLTNNRGQS